MPRGVATPDGTVRVAPNGYSYIKLGGEQVLLHHHIAAEQRGRPIDSNTERVVFVDGDRTNLDPSNIQIVPRKSNRKARRASLHRRVEVTMEELYMLDGEEAVQFFKKLLASYESL